MQRDKLEVAPFRIKHAVVQRASELSPRLKRWIAPEILHGDHELGLPRERCVALRKLGDDVLGDGHGGTRSWNDHNAF